MSALADTAFAGYLAGFFVGVIGGGVFLAFLLLGVMERQLYPAKVGTARHTPSPTRPSWSTIAEVRELTELPEPTTHTSPLVVPKAYERLTDLSRYTRALHSMAARSARYVTSRGEHRA